MHETEKVFDHDEALASVDGDLELLADLIQLFNRDRDEMVGALRDSVRAGDAEGIQAGAHKLKGALSVLAAREATELAFALERQARSGDLTDAAATFAEFEAALARLAPALEKCVGA